MDEGTSEPEDALPHASPASPNGRQTKKDLMPSISEVALERLSNSNHLINHSNDAIASALKGLEYPDYSEANQAFASALKGLELPDYSNDALVSLIKGLQLPDYSSVIKNPWLAEPDTDTYKAVKDAINNPLVSPNFFPSTRDIELEEQVVKLRATIKEHGERLKRISEDQQAKENEIQALTTTLKELQRTEDVKFLLSKVTRDAHPVLILPDSELRKHFFSQSAITAFVVAADIRRSTELMLRARSPELFAEFTTKLWTELEKIYKSNYGIIDKFTGDGILAFFPEFFSGEHAGYYALRASFQAQKAFERVYSESRSSFSCVLKDSGIGVGVDYGAVHLLRMADALTVVGQPVVYACRFASAPAGHTFVNQEAYSKITKSFDRIFQFTEAEIDVKHDGPLLCYDGALKDLDFAPKKPAWCAGQEDRP